MKTTLNPSKEDIREVLDEFFQTGYSVKDFCSVTGHDETILQNWIDQHNQQTYADEDAFLVVNVKDAPQKPAPQRPQPGLLFAKIGDIELYQFVSSDYLKSLKA